MLYVTILSYNVGHKAANISTVIKSTKVIHRIETIYLENCWYKHDTKLKKWIQICNADLLYIHFKHTNCKVNLSTIPNKYISQSQYSWLSP